LKSLSDIALTKSELAIFSFCSLISLIGLVFYFGWLTTSELLPQFNTNMFFMSTNSAVLIALSGLGLSLLLKEETVICFAISGIIFLIALTTMSQHLLAIDLGIDQFFVSTYFDEGDSSPGSMSLLTSLSFIAISGCLASVLMQRRYRLILFLGSFVFGVGFTSFIGVVSDVISQNGFSKQSGISIFEAGALSLIGTILLVIEQTQNIQSTISIHRRNLFRISLVLFIIVFGGWQSFSHVATKRKLADLNIVFHRFELSLTEAIDHHIDALQRMVKRWEVQGGTTFKTWETDASNYISDFDYFESLKWIDPQYKTQWRAVKSTAIRNINVSDAEIMQKHLEHLKKARQFNSIHIGTQNDPKQRDNNLFIYLPIFQRHLFDGFILAELRFDDLVKNIAKTSDIGQNFEITFSDTDKGILFLQQGTADLSKVTAVRQQINFNGYTLYADIKIPTAQNHLLISKLYVVILAFALAFISLFIWLLHLRWSAIQNTLILDSESQTRRMIQLELAKNEERMRAVFNHIADAVILVSESGAITRINRAAERMFGISSIEATNKDIKMIFPSPYNQTEGNVLTELFLDSQVEYLSEQKEMIGIRSNGSIFNMRIAVSQFEINKCAYFCVVVNDITDEKKAAFEKEQYTKILEQKSKEFEGFAYAASHDLKAPLRGIAQLASWIDEDLGDNKSAESTEYLELMYSRISRLQGLLDNLLEYSRIGKNTGSLSQINLELMIDNIFDLLDPPKGFTLTKKLAQQDITTLIVPLEIILRNLINNSIKHHDQEIGNITITLEKYSRTYYQFTVTDDGPGIMQVHHEKIFTMFKTLKPRDEVEGSGMGLSFVRKIIDIYYCTVRVESDGSRGTSFIFTWPTEALLKSYLNEQL
jgi:PAS domain S-box-containing protein